MAPGIFLWNYLTLEDLVGEHFLKKTTSQEKISQKIALLGTILQKVDDLNQSLDSRFGSAMALVLAAGSVRVNYQSNDGLRAFIDAAAQTAGRDFLSVRLRDILVKLFNGVITQQQAQQQLNDSRCIANMLDSIGGPLSDRL
jgi:hypothetical protein